MDFKVLIVILLSAVFVDNYVLCRFLGICPFLGVSKKFDQASGMGIAVTVVMLLATAVTWPIQRFVLDTFNMGYLQNIVPVWRYCSHSHVLYPNHSTVTGLRCRTSGTLL